MIAGSQVRQVQEIFDILPGKQAVLVPRIGYGEAVMVDANMKHEWIIDEYRPTHVVTASSYNSSATSIVVVEADVVQVGQILKNGDERIRVDQITSSTNTLTVTREFAGTTGEDIASGAELMIMAPAFLDTDSFVTSPTRRGQFVYNYPQQIMYSFGQTAMASANRNYLTAGKTELQRSEEKHMYEAVRELEASLIYGKKQAPSSTDHGSFDGIDAFITTHVSASTGLLTETKVIDLLDDVLMDSGGGMGRSIYLNRKTKRVFDAVFLRRINQTGAEVVNEVGVAIQRVHWNGGTFDFVITDLIEDGEAFLLNLDTISINPLDIQVGAGPGWVRGERKFEINNSLQVQQFYALICTVKMTNERFNGKWTGIDVDLSKYPGAA